MRDDRFLTDEEVEEEIELLKQSENVRLARKEQRLKYKRRQSLYQLRALEKRGKELSDMGITIKSIEEELKAMEGEE